MYLPTFATPLHYILESVAQKQHFVNSLLKIIKCTIKTVAFLICYVTEDLRKVSVMLSCLAELLQT